MIGWNLDKMSKSEILDKYEQLVNAQCHVRSFPEVRQNLEIVEKYIRSHGLM